MISKLQADGLIRVGYDWIEVIDPTGLRLPMGLIGYNVAEPVTSALWPQPGRVQALVENIEQRSHHC